MEKDKVPKIRQTLIELNTPFDYLAFEYFMGVREPEWSAASAELDPYLAYNDKTKLYYCILNADKHLTYFSVRQ